MWNGQFSNLTKSTTGWSEGKMFSVNERKLRVNIT